MLLFAIPLALFEIWLDASKKKIGPWGDTKFTGAYASWERNVHFPIFNKMFNHLTIYHFYIFVVIGPIIAIAEYIALHFVTSSWLVMSFAGMKIFSPCYIIAVLIWYPALEDFLWFAIQTVTGKLFGWGEPEALTRLCQGYFKWHEKGGFWPIVPGTKWPLLPKFYFWVPLVIIAVFVIERIIIRFCH